MGWVHESPRGGGRGSRGAAGGRQCAAPLGARGRTSLCSRMSFVHIKYKDSVGLGMEIVEAKEQPRLSREDVWGGEAMRSQLPGLQTKALEGGSGEGLQRAFCCPQRFPSPSF